MSTDASAYFVAEFSNDPLGFSYQFGHLSPFLDRFSCIGPVLIGISVASGSTAPARSTMHTAALSIADRRRTAPIPRLVFAPQRGLASIAAVLRLWLLSILVDLLQTARPQSGLWRHFLLRRDRFGFAFTSPTMACPPASTLTLPTVIFGPTRPRLSSRNLMRSQITLEPLMA